MKKRTIKRKPGTVYAPFTNYKIKAKAIIAEIGFVFYLTERNKVRVCCPWMLADRETLWITPNKVIGKREKLIKKFVIACAKLAKEMSKKYKAEQADKKGR